VREREEGSRCSTAVAPEETRDSLVPRLPARLPSVIAAKEIFRVPKLVGTPAQLSLSLSLSVSSYLNRIPKNNHHHHQQQQLLSSIYVIFYESAATATAAALDKDDDLSPPRLFGRDKQTKRNGDKLIFM